MKRKLNIRKLIIFILVVVTIIFGSVKAIKEYIYSGSVEGKLVLNKYNEDEIKIIKKKLSESEINKITKMKYNKNLVNFLKEKYFIFENLDKYLEFKENNKKEKNNKIVALINTKADSNWYNDVVETDISKNELMLVNKFYSLKEDYKPEDIVKVSEMYAYGGVYAREMILEVFQELCSSAKEAGFTLVSSLGYRSYDEQSKIYNEYKSYNGTKEADKSVARAGNSEHQTGLALEIEPYNKIIEDVKSNEEYNWLIKNAYKFGFIQRYPEGKEDITGFAFEPWHFRYVGTNISVKMKRENITFDEYYAYYIEGK